MVLFRFSQHHEQIIQKLIKYNWGARHGKPCPMPHCEMLPNTGIQNQYLAGKCPHLTAAYW